MQIHKFQERIIISNKYLLPIVISIFLLLYWNTTHHQKDAHIFLHEILHDKRCKHTKFIYLPSLALNISTRIFDWIGFIHDPSLLCWHKHMLGLYIIYPRYKIIQLCVDHIDYFAAQCRRGFDCLGFRRQTYEFRNDHLMTFKTMCNWATDV